MMGVLEIILIVVGIILIIAVANYGKDTALGYWGSIVLALVTSPVVAFFIIMFFLKDKKRI